jgi:hypothetical protein
MPLYLPVHLLASRLFEAQRSEYETHAFGRAFTRIERREPRKTAVSQATTGCAAHSWRQLLTFRAEKCSPFTLFTTTLVKRVVRTVALSSISVRSLFVCFAYKQ